MKKIALAAALSIAATSAFAGGYSEPEVTIPPQVVEAGSSSSMGGSAVLLLLGALAIAAIVAAD